MPKSSPRVRVCAVAGSLALLALAVAALAAPRRAGGSERTAAVTFAGFYAFDDGASRLYVRLTKAVPVEPTLAGKRAEYLLVGATILTRNNKNPLIARHFVTEVVSARLVPEGEAKGKAKARASRAKPADARLIIEMREPVTPAHRMVESADGSATLVIDFPKPKKPPPPEPEETPPSPSKASDAEKMQ